MKIQIDKNWDFLQVFDIKVYFRHYEVAFEDSLSGIVQECFELFKSEPMFRLLTTVTGLKLSDVDIESEKEETDESEKKISEEQDITTKSDLSTDVKEVPIDLQSIL